MEKHTAEYYIVGAYSVSIKCFMVKVLIASGQSFNFIILNIILKWPLNCFNFFVLNSNEN